MCSTGESCKCIILYVESCSHTLMLKVPRVINTSDSEIMISEQSDWSIVIIYRHLNGYYMHARSLLDGTINFYGSVYINTHIVECSKRLCVIPLITYIEEQQQL